MAVISRERPCIASPNRAASHDVEAVLKFKIGRHGRHTRNRRSFNSVLEHQCFTETRGDLANMGHWLQSRRQAVWSWQPRRHRPSCPSAVWWNLYEMLTSLHRTRMADTTSHGPKARTSLAKAVRARARGCWRGPSLVARRLIFSADSSGHSQLRRRFKVAECIL